MVSEAKDLKIFNALTTRPSKDIIPDNNILLKIFCSLVIIVLICIAIGHYAFKNGELTCDHYILNTYLYVILAIVLIFMLVLLNDKYGVFNKLLDFFFYSASSPFVSFTLILVLIIALSYAIIHIPPQNIIASNAVWLLLVLLITLILIPGIYFGRSSGVVGIAGLITIGVVVATGLVGYYYGDVLITFDWDFYLTWALVAWIVVFLVGMFIVKTPTEIINFIYTMSIASLIIFVLLLLSYFKTLKENASKCVDGKVVPNYPLESWKLVIKIANVFKNIIRILGIRKMRR
jgi:FtsH-binding integral membrane protein